MRKLTLLAAVVAVMACDRSKPELEKTLAQVQHISAEKDSMLQDVMATSQFIAQLNSEISTVRNLNAGRPNRVSRGETEDNLTPAQRRAAVVVRVKELTARVTASELRLAASRRRVAELAGQGASMSRQLAAYDSTIVAFKAIIGNQKSEIEALTGQVAALSGENGQLKTEKAQLASEGSQLKTERNTVYYVVGTKAALLKRHIIEQSGGTFGLGKTTIPGRALNPEDFVPIDKTQVAEIPLPDESAAYRIVSLQNLAALEATPDRRGRLTGGLKIKDADSFWAASRYLIVVQQ